MLSRKTLCNHIEPPTLVFFFVVVVVVAAAGVGILFLSTFFLLRRPGAGTGTRGWTRTLDLDGDELDLGDETVEGEGRQDTAGAVK